MRILQLRPNLNQNFQSFLVLFLTFLMTSTAQAWRFDPSDLVYGVLGGFGASGIEKNVRVGDTQTFDISRAESPGYFGISVETVIHDQWTVAIGHRRGFRFGPFSTGVGFTGGSLRYYYLNPVPIIPRKELESSVTLQRWSPFVGFGTGIANGAIGRERDVVSKIGSSGIFFGIHVGVDYHWLPRFVLRPELIAGTTIFDVSAAPATLAEFGLVCGIHFRL